MSIRLLVIFMIFILTGCGSKKSKLEVSQDNYKNMILSVALAYPFIDNEINEMKLSSKGDSTYFGKIVTPYKSIVNSDLHIKVNYHRWSSDPEHFYPAKLIYINTSNDFKYTFPFVDENYIHNTNYCSRGDSLKNGGCDFISFGEQYFPAYSSIEYNLNYVLRRCPELKSTEKLQQFINLLFRDVLEMEPILSETDLDDFNELDQFAGKCTEMYFQKNLDLVSESIASNTKSNELFFKPVEGMNGIWYVDFNDPNRIKVSMINRFCYSIVSF